MKLQPCPKCDSTDLEAQNCGYSSFDVAWVKCRECGLKLTVQCSSNATSDWNRWARDPIKAFLKETKDQIAWRKQQRGTKELTMQEFAVRLIEEALP